MIAPLLIALVLALATETTFAQPAPGGPAPQAPTGAQAAPPSPAGGGEVAPAAAPPQNQGGGIDTSGQGLANLRDPFRRPVFIDPNARPRTELEYYPLEQYRMVGVLTGPEKLRAMLVAPNGKTYFVAESMKIGVRNGVVRKIIPQGIIVRERVPNTLGKEELIDLQLRMPGT